VTGAVIEALSPDEFWAALNRGDSGFVEGRTVKGPVICRGQRIAVPVQALYVTFEGEVDFSESRFAASVDFTGCTFAKTLSFHSSVVEGSLILSWASVRNVPSATGQHMDELPALDLSGARIEGDVELQQSKIAGEIRATASRVGGSLRMLGTEIDGLLDLHDCDVAHDCAIGSILSSDTSAPGYFSSGIDAHDSRIGGTMWLLGPQIAGDVQLWGCDIKSSLLAIPLVEGDRLLPTAIAGSLNLVASKIAGHVELRGASVGGEVNLSSSEIGPVRIAPPLDYPVAMTQPTTIGGLSMFAATVHGDVSLRLVRVTGAVTIEGVRGISIGGSTINGSIWFWDAMRSPSDAQVHGQEIRREDNGAAIVGDIRIRSSIVNGDLDLTNAWVSGTIRLDESKVTRDTLCLSAATLLQEVELSPAFGERLKAGQASVCARASGIDMTKFRCEGDVDLSGLQVGMMAAARAGAGTDAVAVGESGWIKARGLTVGGTVRLQASYLGVESNAAVASFADFSDLRASTFVVSARTFPNATVEETASRGLMLAAAKISTLDIIPIVVPADSGHGGKRKALIERFPVPVDLRDIEVSVWSFGESRLARAERFKRLLAGDSRFRRSTFIAVEQSLRNQGHEADAVTIYRAMMVRARQEQWRDAARSEWPIARRIGLAITGLLFHRPYRHLMGFGSAPLRLLIIIGALWGAMLPAYRHADNFESSQQREGSARQSPPRWTASTAFFSSLQYHVPIIGARAQSNWQLKESGRMRWSSKRDGGPTPAGHEARFLPFFTPAEWGVFVTFLNWALWPLVLTFTARKLLRTP
jgi:hypothetical protein